MKSILAGLTGVVLVLAMGCEGGTTPGLASTDLPGPGQDAVETDTESPGTDLPMEDGWICRPGEAKCMGSVFLVCNVSGSDWITITCTGDQVCTTEGCKVPSTDVIVGTDTAFPDNPPPTDTVVPGDTVQPPEDIVTPVDVPQLTDTILKDPGPTDPGQPTDTVTDANCGNNPPCAANRECCDTPMGLRCVPAGQCQATAGCQSDQDCMMGQQCCPGPFPGAPGQCADSCGGTQGCQGDQDCPQGQQCCPGAYPGAPGECAASCGGGALPTCASDTDCTGGQTCFTIYGNNAYCLSVCEADTDCNGQTCRDIGALGYSLGKVCECTADTDCGQGLSCCDIPYIGQWIGMKTCLTACM